MQLEWHSAAISVPTDAHKLSPTRAELSSLLLKANVLLTRELADPPVQF